MWKICLGKIAAMDQSFCNPLQISEEMIAKVAGDDKVRHLQCKL
jgi:hypothetical protein